MASASKHVQAFPLTSTFFRNIFMAILFSLFRLKKKAKGGEEERMNNK